MGARSMRLSVGLSSSWSLPPGARSPLYTRNLPRFLGIVFAIYPPPDFASPGLRLYPGLGFTSAAIALRYHSCRGLPSSRTGTRTRRGCAGLAFGGPGHTRGAAMRVLAPKIRPPRPAPFRPLGFLATRRLLLPSFLPGRPPDPAPPARSSAPPPPPCAQTARGLFAYAARPANAAPPWRRTHLAAFLGSAPGAGAGGRGGGGGRAGRSVGRGRRRAAGEAGRQPGGSTAHRRSPRMGRGRGHQFARLAPRQERVAKQEAEQAAYQQWFRHELGHCVYRTL